MDSPHAGENGHSLMRTQLMLKIWHPNCWTLETTGTVDAGLIAHGVYEIDDQVSSRVTAYADTRAKIDALIEQIQSSEFTDTVQRITDHFNPNISHDGAGNATEELLVEYPQKNSIHDAFISRRLVPEESIRIHSGHEYWTVITAQSRSEIQRQLEKIRTEMDAEITVEKMAAADSGSTGFSDHRTLSQRQREVIELAQKRGYYTWPRESSANDLADEMEISKTTLLEHLRKAEAKLLGSESFRL
jgi:predicted DNA binding protein